MEKNTSSINRSIDHKQWGHYADISLMYILAFVTVVSLTALLQWIFPIIHLYHQPNTMAGATYVTFLFIIPVVEELGKYFVFYVFRSGNEKSKYIFAMYVGYSFQILEALYYRNEINETMWYIRLFLPMHILWVYIAVRRNVFEAMMLHALWNAQTYMIGIYDFLLILSYYFVWYHYLEKDFNISSLFESR